MASRKGSSTDWNSITRFCAFWSVCIAGLIFTINAIVKLFDGHINFGIINTIATILLLLGVVIPGWRYSRTMPIWVRIAYWVFVILIIAFGAVSISL